MKIDKKTADFCWMDPTHRLGKKRRIYRIAFADKTWEFTMEEVSQGLDINRVDSMARKFLIFKILGDYRNHIDNVKKLQADGAGQDKTFSLDDFLCKYGGNVPDDMQFFFIALCGRASCCRRAYTELELFRKTLGAGLYRQKICKQLDGIETELFERPGVANKHRTGRFRAQRRNFPQWLAIMEERKVFDPARMAAVSELLKEKIAAGQRIRLPH